jgi:hypothetical protein
MQTYNDEISLLKSWYIHFCNEKGLNTNYLTSLYKFIQSTKVIDSYKNKDEVIFDLIESLKENK